MRVGSKNATWDNIPGFDRTQEQYVQLDLNQRLKDHHIEEESKRRSKENQPTTEDDNLDAFEAQIVIWLGGI